MPRNNRKARVLLILPILSAGLVVLIVFVIMPLFQNGLNKVDTRVVPGDASHFDPISVLPMIASYAGPGAQLTSLDIDYVRADGTLDLTASSYRPAVNYKFAHELSATPKDAPPIGAGGNVSGKWYETIRIQAYRPGEWRTVTTSTSEYSYMNQGMERTTDSPTSTVPDVLPAPICLPITMWQEAIKRDAPRDAVATISYSSSGSSFSINGTAIRLDFDHNCKVTSPLDPPTPMSPQ